MGAHGNACAYVLMHVGADNMESKTLRYSVSTTTYGSDYSVLLIRLRPVSASMTASSCLYHDSIRVAVRFDSRFDSIHDSIRDSGLLGPIGLLIRFDSRRFLIVVFLFVL